MCVAVRKKLNDRYVCSTSLLGLVIPYVAFDLNNLYNVFSNGKICYCLYQWIAIRLFI